MPSEWRSLESAPRDGTTVLLWLRDRQRVALGFWRQGMLDLWNTQGDGGYEDDELGGWMPLPERPNG